MHLKNIIQLDGRMIAFDGIEFNEEFQWIDVMSEVAFPVMDFVARGRPDLGWRLLNAYLEATGDYPGLSVLRFYLVYRAMVRAKVTWLNPTNRMMKACQLDGSHSSSRIDELAGPWDKYLSAAKYFAYGLKPVLAITHGFSGSGKSSVALQIIEQSGGIRIRTDVERHRLAEKFKTINKYTPEMSDWVYEYVLEQARAAIESGWPVIVDATFLKRHRRVPFERLARELEIGFQIIDCYAPYEELCKRIRNRGPDPSQATIDVLKSQMETHDPLTNDELTYVRQSGP
jgi:predicted kinase